MKNEVFRTAHSYKCPVPISDQQLHVFDCNHALFFGTLVFLFPIMHHLKPKWELLAECYCAAAYLN